MLRSAVSSCRVLPRSPIAAALATTLAVSASVGSATTVWTVNTCNDTNTGNLLDHSGALRWALNNAASGDAIDLTGLPCSKISLLTGALDVGVATMSLIGPGADKLDIDAGTAGTRVIEHFVADGTLYLTDLSLSSGYFSPVIAAAANGGCLFSAGSVSLNGVEIHSCVAKSNSAILAAGGGVYAAQDLTLYRSFIHDNTASAPAGDYYNRARGGGAATSAVSHFLMSYSTASHNHVVATGTGNQYSMGGGLDLRNGGIIDHSTIYGNTSDTSYGGFRAQHGATVFTFKVLDSTISGNSVALFGSGGGVLAAETTIANSTFAFNHSDDVFGGNRPNAGFVVNNYDTALGIELKSSMFSNNTHAGSEYDFYSTRVVPSGSGNLIVSGSSAPGAITGVCPILAPLRHNGGPTMTHALLGGSAGIDQGNNDLNLVTDQRGSVFARESGGAPDIGAYEVQLADIVFGSGFDGVCP